MEYLIKAILLTFCFSASAEPPTSFRLAKKIMANEIYTGDDQVSFYCGCKYEAKQITTKSGKKRKTLAPDWESCGFEPRKQAKRASRIEWEHVMPAHHFGQHLPCWRKGGRKACKKDPTFKRMEADLMNLVPAIGEVNGDRSNFKYGMIEGEKRVYGQCDAEVDFKAKRFEPAPDVRGDIARIYAYMSKKYKIRVSKQQRQLFQAWHQQDPMDENERIRALKVSELQ